MTTFYARTSDHKATIRRLFDHFVTELGALDTVPHSINDQPDGYGACWKSVIEFGGRHYPLLVYLSVYWQGELNGYTAVLRYGDVREVLFDGDPATVLEVTE